MINLSKIVCVLLMCGLMQNAMANTLSSVDMIKGLSTQTQELQALHLKIVTARSIDEARKLALAPTDDAVDALHSASTLMPLSDDIRIAEKRLHDMRQHIKLAANQQQIADEFSGIMLAGLDNDRAVHLGVGKTGCNYSSGETIAIVLGLILGIIPGLILMTVLC
ncbi:hypothetical protein [Crenothrix polyspora]|uniref:Uncharacterized protein n=1 Tax=Crenothrix polyspora TaxID=360316 RepID=A0A1R4H0L6_9GAMM|nr:hypothetical protein [Crenothrix polyspora]SJM89797.1 conserved exported hypothetical protein [Crenothrix polyspora]